jgi:hypothetical protein
MQQREVSRPSGTCPVFPMFPALKRRAILKRPSGAGFLGFSFPPDCVRASSHAHLFSRTLSQAAEKLNTGGAAPKGAIDFEGFAVSLKRYPDTKLELFRGDTKLELFRGDTKLESSRSDTKLELFRGDTKLESSRSDTKLEFFRSLLGTLLPGVLHVQIGVGGFRGGG